MSQNILDSFGNVIGTMDLGAGATQAQYNAALAPYALASVPVPSSGVNLPTYMVAAQDTTTTSSSQPAVVGSMTVKPLPGTYSADFSGSIYTDGASAQGQFGIYVDGVLVVETRRDIKCNLSLLGGLVTVSLNAIGIGTNTSTELVLNGNQTVTVQFQSNNGGTIGFIERVLRLTKVRS